jgi:hypothetical protein
VYLNAAAPPLWPDETTAIGTVTLACVTFVAIIVTIVITWRDRKNAVTDAERERTAADNRLNRQVEASAAQLQVERAAADARLQRQLDTAAAQLQAEHDAAKDQEQLADAYLVQITPGRMFPDLYGTQVTTSPDTPVACPCVIIVNRGHYTITEIHAQSTPDGRSLLTYGKREHFSALRDLPRQMSDYIDDEPDIRLDTLTPTDAGLRFSHDAIAETNLHGTYP